MRRVLLILIGTLLAGVFLGLIVALLTLRGFGSRARTGPSVRDASVVIRQIQGLNELVTVRFALETVVVAQDVTWYGENRVILVAHGLVKAGVDLAKLGPNEIQLSGQTLKITLPSAEITDIYLDEQKTEVIENKTGLLRLFNKELEQNARREAVARLRSAALSAGIKRDAEERARLQLQNLFLQLGFEQVRVETRHR